MKHLHLRPRLGILANLPTAVVFAVLGAGFFDSHPSSIGLAWYVAWIYLLRISSFATWARRAAGWALCAIRSAVRRVLDRG